MLWGRKVNGLNFTEWHNGSIVIGLRWRIVLVDDRRRVDWRILKDICDIDIKTRWKGYF